MGIVSVTKNSLKNSNSDEIVGFVSSVNGSGYSDYSLDAERLRQLSAKAIGFRRARRALFPEAALRESCWDILLLCFEADAAGKTICVKQIRSELEESSTSVLRRLQELEDALLVRRQRDAIDGRRTVVHLTSEAAERMSHFLINVSINQG